MSTVTAADVQKLRKRTGLPLMDCKKALSAAGGDQDRAVEELRKHGQTKFEERADRETAFGRFGLYIGADKSSGAMVELKCESAPVAGSDEFIQLANDLAQQLATGPGAETADELLAQPSPSQDGATLAEQRDDMFNRIREVFNVGRMQRYDSATGGYSHNAGTVAGVLLSIEGGDDASAKDVSMHVAAMRPAVLNKESLPADAVEKEREILRAAAIEEGKPENIVDRMVEGRMGNFFAERVLLEQPFVKDDSMTVGRYAESKSMKINDMVHWEFVSSTD